MTFFFETYGCQMNSAESAAVDAVLSARGWHRSESAESADLVLINTCSVRITAETRVFGRLAHFSAAKKKRPFVLLVMGCMAERLHNELRERFPSVDYVVGMFERQSFEDIFTRIESGLPGEASLEQPVAHAGSYHFSASSWQEGALQSYVPIMNGCNNFCTYCIVPYVRGREVSREPSAILDEIDFLSSRQVREITLLGQNVNSWQYHMPDETDAFFEHVPEASLLPEPLRKAGAVLTFPDLLFLIARRVEKTGSIGWVRFMSSHPKDCSPSLLDIIAHEPVLCNLIHLPVQHGSNRILSAMNRRYTREQYLDLVSRVYQTIPGAAVSTDILIGFPGETDEDLELTLDLMREASFSSAFMYHYNPREGTRAYDLPDRIPDQVKKDRLDRVITLQHDLTARQLRARVGAEATVLIESFSRNNAEELFGHTELGEMVVFSGKGDPDLRGRFVKATLTGLRGRTLRAKIIAGHPEKRI